MIWLSSKEVVGLKFDSLLDLIVSFRLHEQLFALCHDLRPILDDEIEISRFLGNRYARVAC